ncbi:MAG: hypothetical protein ACRD2B_03470 [Terriglobia bacterium]
MKRKWITGVKTIGLVLLVAFVINLLLVAAAPLANYDRELGDSFHRAVLIILAYLIVRLWQVRDYTKPLWAERRWKWQWLEGKPERKLILLLLVALFSVSGVATYLALHQRQHLLTDAEVGIPDWTALSVTPPKRICDQLAAKSVLTNTQMEELQTCPTPFDQFKPPHR